MNKHKTKYIKTNKHTDKQKIKHQNCEEKQELEREVRAIDSLIRICTKLFSSESCYV